jgi:hypothetical protein
VHLLTNQRHLDFADIGLVGANLEDSFIFDLVQRTDYSFHGKSFPGAVGGAHVLDLILPVEEADGGVDVAEVLVVWEVEEVVGFAADGNLGLFGDLHGHVVRWSLDDGEGEHAGVVEGGLELVGAHLDDHVLCGG